VHPHGFFTASYDFYVQPPAGSAVYATCRPKFCVFLAGPDASILAPSALGPNPESVCTLTITCNMLQFQQKHSHAPKCALNNPVCQNKETSGIFSTMLAPWRHSAIKQVLPHNYVEHLVHLHPIKPDLTCPCIFPTQSAATPIFCYLRLS